MRIEGPEPEIVAPKQSKQKRAPKAEKSEEMATPSVTEEESTSTSDRDMSSGGLRVAPKAPLFQSGDAVIGFGVDTKQGEVRLTFGSSVVLLSPSEADFLGDMLKTHAKHARKRS